MICQVLGNPARDLAGFAGAQGFFRHFARGGEAVTPRIGTGLGSCFGRAGDGRQFAHATRQLRTGGVRAKALVTVKLHGVQHGGVDGGNHPGGVAPGVVAAQQITTQPVAHKSLGRLEHLRLGAAKAVNALLGVAHNEHAGRRGPLRAAAATARAGVAAEPRPQCLPLQRVGVLKFVNQQMLDARVQPLLHPAREQWVAQHDQRGTLHVVHVNPVAFALERTVLRNQQAGQAHHALLVAPSRVLGPGGYHAQHQVLRLAHTLYTDDFFAELARCAGGGQQSVKGGIDVTRRQGHFQFNAFGGKGFGTGTAQGTGRIQQGLPALRLGAQKIVRRFQPGKVRVRIAKVLHGRVNNALGIGQHKLGALVQRGGQRFFGLGAAVVKHHGFKVGFQVLADFTGGLGVGHQGGIKAPPHQRFGGGVVLQQLVVGGQFHALQYRQRRTAQQGGKPTVKGAHLHLAPAGQDALV